MNEAEKNKPEDEPYELHLPLRVDHAAGFCYVVDSHGKKLCTVYGKEPLRSQLADLFSIAPGATDKACADALHDLDHLYERRMKGMTEMEFLRKRGDWVAKHLITIRRSLADSMKRKT